MTGKAIIISAPSGAGKSTIVNRLMKKFPQLEFSISACSRPMREGEQEGKDYFFLTPDQFREKIENGEFVEWEEVYPGSFYGTLRLELEQIWDSGKIPVFDVDVLGGLNLKRYFGADALAVFIHPITLEVLEKRLRNRGTENDESLQERMKRAEEEMQYINRFDTVVVNDDLEEAVEKASNLVFKFI